MQLSGNRLVINLVPLVTFVYLMAELNRVRTLVLLLELLAYFRLQLIHQLFGCGVRNTVKDFHLVQMTFLTLGA